MIITQSKCVLAYYIRIKKVQVFSISIMKGNMPYISREQTEELLNCFNEAIKKPEFNPLLFNIWGIGGVGKTTLLHRLTEQNPNISFARVYFGSTPDIGTPFKLMANLYSQLSAIDDWGQDCEIFTHLYQKYEQTLEKLKQPDNSLLSEWVR